MLFHICVITCMILWSFQNFCWSAVTSAVLAPKWAIIFWPKHQFCSISASPALHRPLTHFKRWAAAWRRELLLNTEIPEWDGVSQDHHKTNKNLVTWEEFIRIINTACYLRVISDSFLSFILLFLSMAKTLLPSDNSVCWLVLVVFSANNMEEIGFDYLWFLFWPPGDEKRELWFKIVICAVQILGICRTVICLGIICHWAFVLLRKGICGDSDNSLHTQFRELII